MSAWPRQFVTETTQNHFHCTHLVPSLYTCDYYCMKERLIKSAAVSLEWRAIAFVITELFFWATTGELWKATALALALQAILFVVHFVWFYFRESAHVS